MFFFRIRLVKSIGRMSISQDILLYHITLKDLVIQDCNLPPTWNNPHSPPSPLPDFHFKWSFNFQSHFVPLWRLPVLWSLVMSEVRSCSSFWRTSLPALLKILHCGPLLYNNPFSLTLPPWEKHTRQTDLKTKKHNCIKSHKILSDCYIIWYVQ